MQHKNLAPKVGDLVELSSFTGKTRELDTANSGIYVIGRIEREYISSTDRMTTNMVLYTDSAGDVETTTQTFDANSNKLVK